MLPQLYQAGIWAALVIGIGFTSVYAWRIASESARMSAGLAATQLALSREHRLASMGALATAAAHELGTPLGTIAVVARELERALPEDSPEVEDVRLLRDQAERCRAILARLANPEEALLGATARLPLGAFLDDIAAPYRGEDSRSRSRCRRGRRRRPCRRSGARPNFCTGWATSSRTPPTSPKPQVAVRPRWDERLDISVDDDGPGFAPEIFERIGRALHHLAPRPSRAGRDRAGPGTLDKHEGMGLGFFIAKILLEQTGGLVKADNPPGGGAGFRRAGPAG